MRLPFSPIRILWRKRFTIRRCSSLLLYPHQKLCVNKPSFIHVTTVTISSLVKYLGQEWERKKLARIDDAFEVFTVFILKERSMARPKN